MKFADGRYYKGQFLDGKFHGIGELTTIDGTVKKGTFNNGTLEKNSENNM